MKKLINISNINSFSSQNKTIATISKKCTIQIFNRSFEIEYKKDVGENLQEIHINNKSIWTNTVMEGKAVILHDGNISVKNFFLTDINNGFFYINQNHKDKKINEFYEVIWEISDSLFTYKLFDNNLCYKKNKNELVLLDNLTGKTIWNFIFPETKFQWFNLNNVHISERSIPVRAEIKRIFGSHNEVLWISLNSGRILGLNTTSGELIYDLDLPINFHEYFSREYGNFESAANSYLDEEKGYIFGLHMKYYWEIDLTDPKKNYLLYDISEQCNRCLTGGSEITDDLVWRNEEIFFYQWSFAQDPSFVGIFNRNTKKITWTSRELGEDGVFKGIKKLDYSENRLYVLDRAETLHIFER